MQLSTEHRHLLAFQAWPSSAAAVLPPLGPLPAIKQVHVDEDGNPTKKSGKISSSYILKHCPIEVGTLYSTRDAQKTLQNVFALDLFDNVQVRPGGCRRLLQWQVHDKYNKCMHHTRNGTLVARLAQPLPPSLAAHVAAVCVNSTNYLPPLRHYLCVVQILPRQNEKDPSRVDVEVMVREKPTQTADVEAEWSVAPGTPANASPFASSCVLGAVRAPQALKL